MTFAEYLSSKKININTFQEAEPARFLEWQSLFEQYHAESFTMQKKFSINQVRRKYR